MKYYIIIFFFILMSCDNGDEEDNTRYEYETFLPGNYNSNTKHPLIVYLHGAGENSKSSFRVTGFLKGHPEYNFIVASLNNQDGGWEPDYVLNSLKHVLENYPIDETKIYLTGISMGGFGTLNTAIKHPNEFDAIVAIAGGTHHFYEVKNIINLPTWILHNKYDPIVDYRESQRVIDQLLYYNADVRYTIYDNPGTGHDAWSQIYNDTTLYNWLLRQ